MGPEKILLGHVWGKTREQSHRARSHLSRGDRIRTYDIQLPKLALYQAELRPVAPVGTESGSGRNRTADTGIFSPLLCQLSYRANEALPRGKVIAGE